MSQPARIYEFKPKDAPNLTHGFTLGMALRLTTEERDAKLVSTPHDDHDMAIIYNTTVKAYQGYNMNNDKMWHNLEIPEEILRACQIEL